MGLQHGGLAGLSSEIDYPAPAGGALLAATVCSARRSIPVGWVGLLVGPRGIVCPRQLPLPLPQHLLVGSPSTLASRPGRFPWRTLDAWGRRGHGGGAPCSAAFAMSPADPVAERRGSMADRQAFLFFFLFCAWGKGGGGPFPGGWPTVLDPGARAFLAGLGAASTGALMTYASLLGSALLAYGLSLGLPARGDLTGFTALTLSETPVFAFACGSVLLLMQTARCSPAMAARCRPGPGAGGWS